MNKNILKSIFNTYSIDKVILVEENDFLSFILCSMQECLSYERWCCLENNLKELLNKEVSLLPLSQAIKYLGKDYLSKGVRI